MEVGDNGVIGTHVQSAVVEVHMDEPDLVTIRHHSMVDQNVPLMAQVLLNLKLVTQMFVPVSKFFLIYLILIMQFSQTFSRCMILCFLL